MNDFILKAKQKKGRRALFLGSSTRGLSRKAPDVTENMSRSCLRSDKLRNRLLEMG